MNTGTDFVKMLRPVGSAIFLLCFIAFLVICFTSGSTNAIPGYTPAHDSDYYAGDIPALTEELQDNVLEHVSGVVSCEEKSGKIELVIEKDSFYKTRAVILKYFDESLFEFVQAG